jgi:putative ABC transport system permease protein
LRLAWTLALRELRGGLSGLRLLAVCLLLGVTALAGVGSLAASLGAALGAQGQAILGGDISFSIAQRQASPEERAAFARLGPTSEVVSMRAMAVRPDGADSLLVELKGVDAAYPLYGDFRLSAGTRPQGAQVAVAPELAERLSLRIGDPVRIGEGTLRVSGLIADEPDRLGQGFSLGSTALVDPQGLAVTRLVQPGSMYEAAYRVRLPAGADPKLVGDGFGKQFEEAGWRIRDRSNGAPGTRRFVDRLGQFLTLVGLTALVIAGIGVGNGVASYLDERRAGMATLKALGATSRTIFMTYFLTVGAVALAAILVGLALGAATPRLVVAFAGDALPIPPRGGLFPIPLIAAAAYGLLIALTFSLIPLAQARAVPAASLFRGGVERLARPSRATLAAVALAAAAIAALAIGTAEEPLFAAGFVAAALGLLLLLTLLGVLIRWTAARLPRPKGPLARLALANLHRPGAQTGRLVVALGLGLTLFTTLAVIETNLSGQIRSTIPARAPSFFLLDIPVADVPRFRAVAARAAPGSDLTAIPSLRAPVVAVDGTRVADMKDIPDGAWILRGDRGLTYAAAVPEGSRVVAGKWWPANYAGPPLVSLDVEAARALNIGVGDTITVSVLGREIEAEIASLREINWDTMGFNFVMVFAPGTLESAPHSFMATVAMPATTEAAFSREVARAFPSVSAIRVKDVIAKVSDTLTQLSTAVRAAAAVTVLAGIAVLVGALAASRRARTYDSVMMKLLGATRRRILGGQALEFGALALIVCAVALALGSAAGWYVVVRVFELNWAPDWLVVGATLAVGALVTLALGLLGALPALAARPAQALRSL